jgi:hypothetical protein
MQMCSDLRCKIQKTDTIPQIKKTHKRNNQFDNKLLKVGIVCGAWSTAYIVLPSISNGSETTAA